MPAHLPDHRATHPLLTRADVRRLLDVHGLAPRKTSGQNFVVDPNTVRKLVRIAGVVSGTQVCEIGPGLGSLTLALREAGASVIAVEVDAGLVRALHEVVGDDTGVRIIHADALDVDLAALVGGQPVMLVSNLPYNVATPIVMKALASRAFSELFVVVQREVGQRWVAGVGDSLYGAVSVKIHAQAAARISGAVSRSAFYPTPNVESVAVSLVPCPWTLPVGRDQLFALVDAGFGQRRKRLRNALATSARTADAIESALAGVGLDPAARAEELDLRAWAAFARVLYG
ncbi:MAG: 16S rRNA (adenine(1518)-N(6)/adenine(1519)-N(6))-dimethyltransferase RsmA [Egibacteraceae bacterium]